MPRGTRGGADDPGEGVEHARHVGGGRRVKGLAHDQDLPRLGPDRRAAALPKRPAPSMRVVGRIGKDHFAGLRGLDGSVEGEMLLVASGMADLQVVVDSDQVEDRHRQREGERDGVAEIHEGVQARQRLPAAEPPEQRLGGRAVLGRLQTHLGVGAPPRRHLGQLGFRSAAQALAGALVPRIEQGADLDLRPDLLHHEHAGHELRELVPEGR